MVARFSQDPLRTMGIKENRYNSRGQQTVTASGMFAHCFQESGKAGSHTVGPGPWEGLLLTQVAVVP